MQGNGARDQFLSMASRSWADVGIPPQVLGRVPGTLRLQVTEQPTKTTPAENRAAGGAPQSKEHSMLHSFDCLLPVPVQHPAQLLFESARLVLWMEGLRVAPRFPLGWLADPLRPEEGAAPPPWLSDVELSPVLAAARKARYPVKHAAPSTPAEQAAFLTAWNSSLILHPYAEDWADKLVESVKNTTLPTALTWLTAAAAAGHPASKVLLAHLWLYGDRALLPDAAWRAVSALLRGNSGKAVQAASLAHLRRLHSVVGGHGRLLREVQTAMSALQTAPTWGFSLTSMADAQLLLASAVEDLETSFAPLVDVLQGRTVSTPWYAILHSQWVAEVSAAVAADLQQSPLPPVPARSTPPAENASAYFAHGAGVASPRAWASDKPGALRLAPVAEAAHVVGAAPAHEQQVTEAAESLMYRALQHAMTHLQAPNVKQLAQGLKHELGSSPTVAGEHDQPWPQKLAVAGPASAPEPTSGSLPVGLIGWVAEDAGALPGVRDALEAWASALSTLALLAAAKAPAPTFSAIGGLHAGHGDAAPWLQGHAVGPLEELLRQGTLPGALPLQPASDDHPPAQTSPAEAAQALRKQADEESSVLVGVMQRLGAAGDPVVAMGHAFGQVWPQLQQHPAGWPEASAWNGSAATPADGTHCQAVQAAIMKHASRVLQAQDMGAAGTSPPMATLWEDSQVSAAEAEKDDSLEYLQSLAEQGNGPAAARMGEMHYHGDEVAGRDRDMQAAHRFWRMAADAGHAAGHANLGMLYVNGLGPAPEGLDGQGPEGAELEAAEAGAAVDVGGQGVGGGGFGVPAGGGADHGGDAVPGEHGGGHGQGAGAVQGGGGVGHGAAGGGAEAAGGRQQAGAGAGAADAPHAGAGLEGLADEPFPGDEDFDPLAPRRHHMLSMLPDGRVVNVTGALFHYHTAAEMGEPSAYNGLGYIYMTGMDGAVPPNITAAALYFAMATEAGVAEAAGNLAVMYLGGNGVPLNGTKARQLLEFVGQQHPPIVHSTYNLGLLHAYGWDPEAGVSCPEAVKHFLTVVSRGPWQYTYPASLDLAVAAFNAGMASLGKGPSDAALTLARGRVKQWWRGVLDAPDVPDGPTSSSTALPAPAVDGAGMMLPHSIAPHASLLDTLHWEEPASSLGGGQDSPPSPREETPLEVVAGTVDGLARGVRSVAKALRAFGRTAAHVARRGAGDTNPIPSAFNAEREPWSLQRPLLGVRDIPMPAGSPPSAWRAALRHTLTLSAAGSLPGIDDSAWLLDKGVGREDWAPITYFSPVTHRLAANIPLMGHAALHLAAAAPSNRPAWLRDVLVAANVPPDVAKGSLPSATSWALLQGAASAAGLQGALQLSAYTHAFALASPGAEAASRALYPSSGGLGCRLAVPGAQLPSSPAPTCGGPQRLLASPEVWGVARGLAATRLYAAGAARGGRRAARRAGECALAAALDGGETVVSPAEVGGVRTLYGSKEGPLRAVLDVTVGKGLGGFVAGACPANGTLGLALLHTAESRGDAAASLHLASLQASGVAVGGGERSLIPPSVQRAWSELDSIDDGAWARYHAVWLQHRLVWGWAAGKVWEAAEGGVGGLVQLGRAFAAEVGGFLANHSLEALSAMVSHNEQAYAANLPEPQWAGLADEVRAAVEGGEEGAGEEEEASVDGAGDDTDVASASGADSGSPGDSASSLQFVRLGPVEVQPQEAGQLLAGMYAAAGGLALLTAWLVWLAVAAVVSGM